MRPGLMITLENCLGLGLLMYVSMPEAVNFSMKLIRAVEESRQQK